MDTTGRQTGAPAQPENNVSTLRPFEWYASDYNMAFARLAARESANRYDLDVDVCGIGTSPMYSALAQGFLKALAEARSEGARNYACDVFAARCYRAGREEGARCDAAL